MKKIIISSIATITLIVGGVMLIPLNQPSNHVEDTPKQHLEAQQSVIEPETVTNTPEVIEPVVEAPVVNEPVKAEPKEDKTVVFREPTFGELVSKYKIKGDDRLPKLEQMFNNRTRTAPAEDRFLLFMSLLKFDMTYSNTIYDRDEAYRNWRAYLNSKEQPGF